MSRPAIAALMLCTVVPSQERTAPPDCTVLEQEFQEARADWNRRRADASRDGDRAVLAELAAERPETVFLPRFLAGAEATAGTDAAVPFLVWIVTRGDSKASLAAMTTLMHEHVSHPGIRLAVARLGGIHGRIGLEQTRTWLDRALAENGDAKVQAQARYTRAALYVGTRAAERSEELRQLAIADLKLALDSEERSLRGLAEGLLFEAEHLEPGLVAPEIEGEDLDGVAFRLSDYRGKVVVLDFWGDW